MLLLLVLSFGIFSLLYLAPGDIVQSLLGARQSSPELIAQLRAQYHLDDPFLTQYWIWLQNALHGDLGHSTVTGLPVTQAIKDHAGVTVFLGLYAFAITTFFGVSLGVAAAVRKRSAADRGIVGFSVIGVSMPAFVTGIVLLYLLAVRVSAGSRSSGRARGSRTGSSHLTLPAIALALTAGRARAQADARVDDRRRSTRTTSHSRAPGDSRPGVCSGRTRCATR